MTREMISVVYASADFRTWLRRVLLFVPLFGIILSEGLVYFGQLEMALVGHLLTLLYCTTITLRLVREIPVLMAFALVPLFRLVNLGIPVFIELTILWLPVIYGAMLPGLYLFASHHSLLSFSSNKLIQLIVWLPVAVFLSFLLAAVEYFITRPTALIPTWNVIGIITLTLIMIGLVGLVEELLFRGILQRTLVERFGAVTGIVVASLAFGAMHASFRNPLEIGFAVAFGLGLGLTYKISDNLGVITIIHGSVNVFLFGWFPLLGPLLAP